MSGFGKYVIIGLALAGLSGLTYAAGTQTKPMSSGGGSFEKADKNGDGKLDAKEAAAAGVSLQSADANKDGKIDKREYDAAEGKKK